MSHHTHVRAATVGEGAFVSVVAGRNADTPPLISNVLKQLTFCIRLLLEPSHFSDASVAHTPRSQSSPRVVPGTRAFSVGKRCSQPRQGQTVRRLRPVQ
jgi:hypothetical protein